MGKGGEGKVRRGDLKGMEGVRGKGRREPRGKGNKVKGDGGARKGKPKKPSSLLSFLSFSHSFLLRIW